MANLYDMPNFSQGIDTGLVGLSSEVPIFFPMFLFFIWIVIFLGGANAQKRRTGSSDIPMWATLSSLSTLMITLGLTFTTGMINMLTLIIVVVVTIISGAWLFLDKRNNEI